MGVWTKILHASQSGQKLKKKKKLKNRVNKNKTYKKKEKKNSIEGILGRGNRADGPALEGPVKA